MAQLSIHLTTLTLDVHIFPSITPYCLFCYCALRYYKQEDKDAEPNAIESLGRTTNQDLAQNDTSPASRI